MPHVIITEDVLSIQQSLVSALTAEGHTCDIVAGHDMRELVDNAVRMVDENPNFVLILDFNLRHGPTDGEIWGGIWLYTAMRDRGALTTCRRVIVASRYIPENLRALRSVTKTTDAFVARVFVELENIPDKDIFKLDVGNAFQSLATRVTEIFGENDVLTCPRCSRVIE